MFSLHTSEGEWTQLHLVRYNTGQHSISSNSDWGVYLSWTFPYQPTLPAWIRFPALTSLVFFYLNKSQIHVSLCGANICLICLKVTEIFRLFCCSTYTFQAFCLLESVHFLQLPTICASLQPLTQIPNNPKCMVTKKNWSNAELLCLYSRLYKYKNCMQTKQPEVTGCAAAAVVSLSFP